MHPNAELITRFYSAFAKLDHASMAACYHPDAEFSDPVFPDLHGRQIGMMWKMLCLKAKEFSIQFGDCRGRRSARLRELGGAISLFRLGTHGHQQDPRGV